MAEWLARCNHYGVNSYTLNTLNLCKSLFPLQSTEEEIKRLAEFLGVGCNNKLSREICEMCSFSVMKQDKDPLEDASEWKHGEPGMYRKGKEASVGKLTVINVTGNVWYSDRRKN